MFTYILPSIFATNRIYSQIIDVLNHPLIEKVILVTQQNVGDDNLEKLGNILEHKKLAHIIAKNDSFCNGKWNLGVEYGVFTDNLILATDDINFNTEIFDRVSKLNLREYGIMGVGSQFKQHISRPSGFGQMMFMDKNHYTVIPQGIKHWYGDDWVFYQMSLAKKPNYTIECEISTHYGESSNNELVEERIQRDIKWWETNKEQFKEFLPKQKLNEGGDQGKQLLKG